MYIMVTGTMGSGKSAYGSNTILTKKDQYRNIYANFNGLKLHDNIKSFNFNYFRSVISDCKNIYDQQIANLGENSNTNVIDKPIIDYLISIDFIELNENYAAYISEVNARAKLNIFKRTFLNIVKPIKKVDKFKPNLFCIDECQNHFPSVDPITGKNAAADPVLIWGITYHRHLFMDVILFTQDYSQIHASYLKNMQFFLDAVDADNMLLGEKSPHLKYIKHMKTPYYKTNKAGSVKVKKRKELFDLYESGDVVRTKSAVLPYVYLALFLLVVAGGVFSYAIDSLGTGSRNEDIIDDIEAPVTSRIVKNVKSESLSIGDTFYIKLDCIDDFCVNKDLNINLNIDDLNATVTTTKSKILTIKKLSAYRGYLTLMATQDFLNLFKGGLREKNNKNFNLLN